MILASTVEIPMARLNHLTTAFILMRALPGQVVVLLY
jgi:hypothetical protein